ncbi:MAG: hypothetical protein EA409_11470 [Saprospirales bacterium]|nr:MAG: hypothetical protein EA409_11470 [Saprospirales bacterium]
MKRFIKLLAVSFILALSVFSYAYVNTDVSNNKVAFTGQNNVELSQGEVSDSERTLLLPESKIIQYISEKAIDLFSSVITLDN